MYQVFNFSFLVFFSVQEKIPKSFTSNTAFLFYKRISYRRMISWNKIQYLCSGWKFLKRNWNEYVVKSTLNET